MSLFKIALANIKKRKSSAITFFAIIVMSALMLSIALSLLLNANSFYQRKRVELNACDMLITLYQSEWSDEMITFINEYSGVTEFQATSTYIADLKYYKNASQKNRNQFVLNNSDTIDQLEINKVSIIDELSVKPSSYAYLPLGYKYSGFKTGDSFYLDSAIKTYEFTVCGFFEDTQMGASTMSIKAIYVDPQSYASLAGDVTFSIINLLAIQFERMETSYIFQTDFSERFKLNDGFILDNATAINAHTMFAIIMSFVLILVSAIVIAIALIIARFSINNTIKEDVKSLGALKSIGFTSRQIVVAIILQFLFIAIIGCLVGILLGAMFSGYVGNIVTATSGLLWSSLSFFVPSIIALVAICTITVLIAYFTARKSKGITPIVALRSGIETHSFNKNHAPLTVNMPLNLLLATKNLLASYKNSITAFVVVLLFAFLSVVGFTLHHNFVTDTSTFVQMLGIEPSEVQLGVFEDDDVDILNEVNSLDDVVSITKFGSFSTISNGKTLYFNVWEDITQKRRNNLIDGRYPIYNNEISLLATAVGVLGKGLGDVVTLEHEGATASYLIVGITQGASSDVRADMTLEGFKRLKSDVVLRSAYVYLAQSDADSVDSFINQLRIQYGSKISVYNLVELVNVTLVALKSPVAIVTYLVLLIIIATIVFVFSLLVITIISLKKRDLGIMKALGFTTKQLILQMLITFLPSIVLGSLIGTMLGFLLTNPVLSVMFSSLGITRAYFTIPALVVIPMQFIILAVCIATICLISLKIKGIAPQRLITEQ